MAKGKVKRRSTEAQELASLHTRFRELLESKDRWRQVRDEASEIPHVGKKQFLIDPECDAPPGTCRRCKEWSAANLAHIEAVAAFNRVARQLAYYTDTLRVRRGRELSVAKGRTNRQRVLDAALQIFGERAKVPLYALLRQIPSRLGRNRLTERTLRRHLKHREVLDGLEKQGKKII